VTSYLSYKFEDTKEAISTYDELPLWSAPFGLLLFKHLELKPGLRIIDIGSGAGFPVIELAERFGKSCTLYGIDTWANANDRAKQKIKNFGLTNVEIIEGSAEKIPFDSSSIDLMVSNLGINNFENPLLVFTECNRVLKHKGKLVLTTNLNGHWIEFYNVFEETLLQLGKNKLANTILAHQEHRGTVESISKLFTGSGFKITRHFEESFEMKFSDGSAFLNHHFVKLGWLASWKNLLPEKEMKNIFLLLEENLNSYSCKHGGLELSVPMAFIEGEKI
jgi:arsenite methyltransferase